MVFLLSDFIDGLIGDDQQLIAEENSPHMDIHLDLDLIKNAQAMDQDLDNKSLLALCLVLLKQVQPYVTDFEAQESKFM